MEQILLVGALRDDCLPPLLRGGLQSYGAASFFAESKLFAERLLRTGTFLLIGVSTWQLRRCHMPSCARLFFGQTLTNFSTVLVARLGRPPTHWWKTMLLLCGQLRLTSGTVLRIAVDAGSIWTALLFGGLLIEGGDFSALILRLIIPQFPDIVPLVGLFSILTLVTYTRAGLYTCIHRYTLSAKIHRIVGINLVLFAIAGAVYRHRTSDSLDSSCACDGLRGFDIFAMPRKGSLAHSALRRWQWGERAGRRRT